MISASLTNKLASELWQYLDESSGILLWENVSEDDKQLFKQAVRDLWRKANPNMS